MWICITMKKIRLFNWFVLEIWLIKKPCNLIDWEHFSPYLRNKNFIKYGICAGTPQKKTVFGPFSLFWGQIIFYKIRLRHAQLHMGFNRLQLLSAANARGKKNLVHIFFNLHVLSIIQISWVVTVIEHHQNFWHEFLLSISFQIPIL